LLRRLAILFFSFQLLALCPPDLRAQEGPPVRLYVQPGTGAARLELGELVSDSRLLEAIHSGLPLRIRILVQLWRDGFFDNQEGQHQWRASVIFDPLTRRYRVQALGGSGEGEEVNTLEEVHAMFRQSLDVPLRPQRSGRYYYMANVEMETLSLSDLQELQRWLQGDLAPAVAGEERVGSALARGVRRILVRMLGLPARRFEVKSPSFVVGSGAGAGD
jgi:hypothetical protein